MKCGLIVVLLMGVCSTMPAAHSVMTSFYYQQELHEYLLLYGMMRAAMDAPVRIQLMREPVPFQQPRPQLQAVVQPGCNKTKKQKRQYHNNNNNNRADRQKHAQINMRVHQPQVHHRCLINKCLLFTTCRIEY